MTNIDITMQAFRKRIEKRYNSIPFKIEDGLCTYDLQLLSLKIKYKKKTKVLKKEPEDLLVA